MLIRRLFLACAALLVGSSIASAGNLVGKESRKVYKSGAVRESDRSGTVWMKVAGKKVTTVRQARRVDGTFGKALRLEDTYLDVPGVPTGALRLRTSDRPAFDKLSFKPGPLPAMQRIEVAIDAKPIADLAAVLKRFTDQK